MTAKELESKAWRVIAMAKVAVNKTRRKVLMQEAHDLLKRAGALRQVEMQDEEMNGGFSTGEQAYRMRLSNDDGTTLWVYLQAESRPDAIWAASALARACSDHYEDFDLWDGSAHVTGAQTKEPSFLSDTAEEVAAASQQSLLETEEAILRSEISLAASRQLLDATAALRTRLTRHEN